MSEGKVQTFYSNYMSMSTSLSEAQATWPKAEWIDIRAYVEKPDYLALQEKCAALEAEVTRLHRVIANELTENDEFGCEYTYVNVLREQNEIMRAALEIIAKQPKRCEPDEYGDVAEDKYGAEYCEAYDMIVDDAREALAKAKATDEKGSGK